MVDTNILENEGSNLGTIALIAFIILAAFVSMFVLVRRNSEADMSFIFTSEEFVENEMEITDFSTQFNPINGSTQTGTLFIEDQGAYSVVHIDVMGAEESIIGQQVAIYKGSCSRMGNFASELNSVIDGKSNTQVESNLLLPSTYGVGAIAVGVRNNGNIILCADIAR